MRELLTKLIELHNRGVLPESELVAALADSGMIIDIDGTEYKFIDLNYCEPVVPALNKGLIGVNISRINGIRFN
jgi:hypothetical protein